MVFWGLVLEPKKKYSMNEVEKPFHVSMASLDLNNCDQHEDSTAVILRKSDSDFILCNLSRKRGIFNVPLDLQFELGSEINFHVAGNSTVHLTGCHVEEEMEDFDSDESLGEEEEDENLDNNLKNILMKKTDKLMNKSSPSPKKVVEANVSKRKQDSSPLVASKKSKLESIMQEALEDEDEDDSDFDLEEESSDDMGEEEEEGESDEEEDDDEDDDEEEEENGEAPEVLNKQAAGNKQKKQGDKQQQGKQQNQPTAKASPKADQKSVQQSKKEKKEKAKAQANPQPNKAAKVSQSNGMPKKNIDGVLVEDVQIGNGAVAKPGKMVSVYYVGRLKQNNKQFDATQSGQGFKFRLGKGEVIKGWDVGISGMKVGSKRRLTIPAKMAYGAAGAPPQIPPNSTLVFDVELRNVK